MVSALVPGSNGPGSSLGRGHCVVSWAKHLTLTVPFFTQVYKSAPANLMLGVTLRWTGIPSRLKTGGWEKLVAASSNDLAAIISFILGL